MKLAEIYAARRDTAAFQNQANDIYGATRGEGDEWAHIAALGFSIDPANPLYANAAASGAPAAAPALSQSELDEQAALQQEFKEALRAAARGGKAPEVPEAPAALPAEVPAPADSNLMDFDIGAVSFEPDSPEETGIGQQAPTLNLDKPSVPDMDFRLPEDVHASPKETAAALIAQDRHDLVEPIDLSAEFHMPPPGGPAPEMEMLSFDLDLPPKAAAPAAAPVAEFDFGALDNNFEEGSPEHMEMETKLDLAMAYQEMGNEDGARELLDEVIKGGNAQQIARANEMRAAMV